MPQKVLKFTGINRKVNEFQNSGACEELINLRPKPNGGCEIVRNKSILLSDANYDQFVEHSWGKYDHQIVVADGVVYWKRSSDGKDIEITREFSGKTVSISTAGNVLVVYCEDKAKQLAFKFEKEEYKPYEVKVPRITKVSVDYDYDYRQPQKGVATGLDTTISAMKDAFAKASSAFYNSYPNGLCGAAIVGCAYVLEDGTELCSTGFICADATKIPGFSEPITSQNTSAVVYGARTITLNLSLDEIEDSNVKKINIYATRPVFPYDLVNDGGLSSSHAIVRKSLDDMKLDNQLMYFQGSVDADKSNVSLTLNFSVEQGANDIMSVLPAANERTGDIVSYNNRFHYYKSNVEHIIQASTVTNVLPTATSPWICYVKFKDSWKLLQQPFEFNEAQMNDFVYPLAGVSQMAFVRGVMQDGVLSVPYREVFFVDMKDSDAYNYSYAFDVTPVIEPLSDELFAIWSNDVQMWGYPIERRVAFNEESNAINVSAPYNPFVFPVNYSYSFGGEIKDIATSYLPISSTQVGQYPITVFTTNGIYALEQGSGAVLYGNVVPLQPHVIEGKALSTPHGTFFASSKKLYILSGREAFSVSQALDGHRELNVRNAAGFRKLCLGGSTLHSFANEVSMLDFRDFISGGCNLTYDQLNNEVLISRNDVSYSYVFNINTKAFHKVPKKYAQAMSNSRYVIETTGETKNVVDLHTENPTIAQHIMMLSRPFSLEAFYTHIDRLILFADASLDESWGHNLCISVFASDNLNDWKCIISAQKHDTIFRQIRTNRAARSYKDYMILINGTVSADTDISEIIADYTVVSRRLG